MRPSLRAEQLEWRQKELKTQLGSFTRSRAAVAPPCKSVYSVCFVMPQIASQLAWPPGLTGRVVQCYFVLLVTWAIQSLYLYEILHVELIRDATCNQNSTKCVANGFVKTWAYFPDYGRWTLCADEVPNNGQADNLLPQVTQQLCILVFVVALFADLRIAFNLLECLIKLPNKKGVWLVGRKFEDLGLKDLCAQETLGLNIQVDSVPFSWKIFYSIFLIIPKILLVLGLLLIGTCYLFNESDRKELILNAFAYVFVSQVDLLLFDAVIPNDIKEKLDNLQAYTGHLEKGETTGTDSDSEVEENDSDSSDALGLHRMMRESRYNAADYVKHNLSNLIHPMSVVACTFAVFKFYKRRCGVATTPPP